ncbi:MAG: hypothetical protein M3N19_06445 [Candidatus Eremiobacteraeota bacterium]|nr:hypothetical protein [Candidatus Eremiobacteraeota bacterium]
MPTRLKNINPVQCGIVLAVMYAFLGIIFVVLMAPFMALIATMGINTGNPASSMGFAGLLVFPIIYGVLGFISGLLSAFIYNLVAGWTGGVEITLTQ